MSPCSVALVGARAVGKSTLGRALAAATGRRFVDLDEDLVSLWGEEHPGRAVPDGAGAVLLALGEPAFRDLEARSLRRVLDGDGPLVLATGGGCVESSACRSLLSAITTLWLEVPPEELRRRLRLDPTFRPPLVTGPDGGSATDEVEQVLARRAPLYAQVARARVDLDGADPAQALARVRAALLALGA